jgi:hypothetical protein
MGRVGIKRVAGELVPGGMVGTSNPKLQLQRLKIIIIVRVSASETENIIRRRRKKKKKKEQRLIT